MRVGIGLGFTTPWGGGGGGGSFAPTDLTWGLLLLPGDYSTDGTTGTWTATVGPNMLDSDAEPGVDGANGWPDFVAASQQYLNTSTATMADVATVGAGTVWAVIRPDIEAATNASPAEEAAVFTDGGAGRIGITFTTDGVRGFMTDGSYKSLNIDVAAGSVYVVAFRWDSSNIKLRVNTTDATPVACGALTSGENKPRLGRNYAAVAYDGLIKAFGIAPTALSDDDLTNLYNWAVGQGLT